MSPTTIKPMLYLPYSTKFSAYPSNSVGTFIVVKTRHASIINYLTLAIKTIHGLVSLLNFL